MSSSRGRGGRRKWILLGAVAVLAIHGAVYTLYTAPRLARVRRASSLLERARAAAQEARKTLDAEQARVTTLRRNDRRAKRFFTTIIGSPRVEMVPDLLTIEQAARDAGLTIDRRSYQQTRIDEAPLLHLVTSLPVSGRYRQVVAFLSALERSPRFIVVDSINARSGQGGDLDVRVAISTYYRAESEQTAWEPPS
jgi:Tfp pilus assembly protein PilO